MTSTFDRVQLAAVVDELRALVPALADALEADSGALAGERVSGSSEHSLPFNVDVAGALRLLDRDLVSVVQYASETVGEPGLPRTVAASLAHAERLHERLLVLGNAAGALHLFVGLRDCLRVVRLALGLSRPDREIGKLCPMHDADLSPLVTPGPVGEMVWKAGRPSVVLRYEPRVCCRRCEAVWVPSQYAMLGVLVDEADKRRRAARVA